MNDMTLQEALKHQAQIDEEGIMVGVSRQAVDEAIQRIAELEAENERLQALADELEALLAEAQVDAERYRKWKENGLSYSNGDSLELPEWLLNWAGSEKSLTDCQSSTIEQDKRIAELKAELADARADAERYRVACDESVDTIEIRVWIGSKNNGGWEYPRTKNECDRIIDAMEGE